jgi:hypothetical protein
MTSLRDYEQWHRRYDDPESDLSWRLRTVQGSINRALNERAGSVRVVSSCAGEGKDILGVLSARPGNAQRVTATLIEIHPAIAYRARTTAASLAARVDVRVTDAGHSDAYRGAVPADLVLLVGIFGNISDADLERTIATAPELCAAGATLIWSCARHDGDRNDVIRARLAAAGFVERDYSTLDVDTLPAVGTVRYEGPPRALTAGLRMFTFLR